MNEHDSSHHLLPWSIDLRGALAQVNQLGQVTDALHLAHQWRQQEARARTPFLLLRILAFTRAFQLHEQQQSLTRIRVWKPPSQLPLLESLSRTEQTSTTSYGTRMREYGQSCVALQALKSKAASARHELTEYAALLSTSEPPHGVVSRLAGGIDVYCIYCAYEFMAWYIGVEILPSRTIRRASSPIAPGPFAATQWHRGRRCSLALMRFLLSQCVL